MDSCGRTRTATSQLIEFLPELQSTKKSNGRHPFKFCLVDDIGLKNETDIYKSLEEINFPIVETDVNINSAKKLMEVIFLFLQELRWERFAIVHSNSKFSTSMLRHFTKSFKKFDFCIPWLINSDRMNEEELKTVFDFQVPIVSLLPSEEHFRFLKTLRSVSEPDKKIPIFFSDFVSRRHLKLIPVDSVRVFSVTLQPESENGFENYYSNNWLTSERRRDDELSLIERTKTVRKIKRIGEKISEVLKNAIESYCYVDQKLCQSLMTPDGRDFISESLEEVNWADEEQSYQLVEYRFEFFDVHLHKVE